MYVESHISPLCKLSSRKLMLEVLCSSLIINWNVFACSTQEMESYMCHFRELAEERAETLESETEALRSRLESSQHQANTLANLLRQSGLRVSSEDSIGEQVNLIKVKVWNNTCIA